MRESLAHVYLSALVEACIVSELYSFNRDGFSKFQKRAEHILVLINNMIENIANIGNGVDEKDLSFNF